MQQTIATRERRTLIHIAICFESVVHFAGGWRNPILPIFRLWKHSEDSFASVHCSGLRRAIERNRSCGLGLGGRRGGGRCCETKGFDSGNTLLHLRKFCITKFIGFCVRSFSVLYVCNKLVVERDVNVIEEFWNPFVVGCCDFKAELATQ